MSFEFHKKRIFMNTFLCMVGVQLAHTDCPSEMLPLPQVNYEE